MSILSPDFFLSKYRKENLEVTFLIATGEKCVIETSQELRMLSTLDCQVTKIVMKSGSELKEL